MWRWGVWVQLALRPPHMSHRRIRTNSANKFTRCCFLVALQTHNPENFSQRSQSPLFHPAPAFLRPVMAATISSSPHDQSSPLEPSSTFSSQFARTLVEDYAKKEPASDPTSKILLAFLDHLPPDGLCNVCDDIIEADRRHDLRGLADYFVSNILVPSMSSPVFYLPQTPLPLLTT